MPFIESVPSTEYMIAVNRASPSLSESGETFKLVLGNVSGAVIADAEAIGTILNTGTAALTGFTLVNADAASDVGSIGNGARFTLDDPANGRFGVRVETAENAAIGSVRLELSGAKTTARIENVAPWSLYGDDGTTLKGEGLPAGSYTLSATAYSKPNLGGDALQTLTVSFTVVAADETTVEEASIDLRPAPDRKALNWNDSNFSSSCLILNRFTFFPTRPPAYVRR